jgi:hypothetical protein
MLTKEEIREGIGEVPLESILSNKTKRPLTPKQKAFVKEVVINKQSKGKAYKKVYNSKMNTQAVSVNGHKLAKQTNVALEIERVKMAMEAMEYRSPSHLRALVVQSLTEVLLDDDAKHSDKINASKVIGEITGVDLFKPVTTESKAVTSKVAKDQILNEIKRLIKGQTSDDVVDIEAHTLLEELAAEAHPGAAPSSGQTESLPDVHSIPHKQSTESIISDFPNQINDLRSESDSDVPHPSDLECGQAVDKNRETPPGDESDGFHR